LNKFKNSSDSNESPRTSLSSSKFEEPKKFGKCMSRKSIWILIIFIAIILIGAAVSVSVYFALRNDKNFDTGNNF